MYLSPNNSILTFYACLFLDRKRYRTYGISWCISVKPWQKRKQLYEKSVLSALTALALVLALGSNIRDEGTICFDSSELREIRSKSLYI